jgi:tetrahedral aminopeptidase
MHLLELARRNDLRAQDGLFAGYGSDGLALWESGTPTALLTVPTRYTHTGFEAIDPADLQTTVDLLRALVTGPLP